MCHGVSVPRSTPRLITNHRVCIISVVVLITVLDRENMSSGLSPSSAMATVVAAAVMLVGGGTLTAATATLSASISVASCRAACLHVVSFAFTLPYRPVQGCAAPGPFAARACLGLPVVRESLGQGHAAARDPA